MPELEWLHYLYLYNLIKMSILLLLGTSKEIKPALFSLVYHFALPLKSSSVYMIPCLGLATPWFCMSVEGFGT